MIQDQDSRGWPAAGTSVTLTVAFKGRQTKGTGSFGDTDMPANLAIVFPGGRNDIATVSSIREVIVQHALNHEPLIAWYNPPNVTPEAAIRQALSVALEGSQGWGAFTVMVFFDGQFGPVLVA